VNKPMTIFRILICAMVSLSSPSFSQEQNSGYRTIRDSVLVDPGGEFENYDALVLHDFEKHKAKYEHCALVLDSGVDVMNGPMTCAPIWGRILAERAYIGLETGYADAEILYVLRSGLCDERTIQDNDRDGPKMTCEMQFDEMKHYLCAAYRKGLFGLPKSNLLAECWREPGFNKDKCEKLELRRFGRAVMGTRRIIP
jgi:hypothetical protein